MTTSPMLSRRTARMRRSSGEDMRPLPGQDASDLFESAPDLTVMPLGQLAGGAGNGMVQVAIERAPALDLRAGEDDNGVCAQCGGDVADACVVGHEQAGPADERGEHAEAGPPG